MPRLLLLFILWSKISLGQSVQGRVQDKETGRVLQYALVKNSKSGIKEYSDTSGYYSIDATADDQLVFSHPGYHSFYLSGKAITKQQVIQLKREEIELKEVEITSDMARFKRDSALNHTLYRKELIGAKSKAEKKLLVKTGEIGVTYDGLISEGMTRLSGKKKRYRKLAKSLEENERLAFVNVRYNTALVSSITGLKEAGSVAFIKCHPMPYEFARQATELELKSWIMAQYKTDVVKGEKCG